MSIHSRVTQDRRWLARVPALMACEFTFDGITRPAVIVDLSLNGAFLSSNFLPPRGCAVRILLQSPQLKKPLRLDGTVVRGGWGMSDHGKVSRFGIRFKSPSPELISVLRDLVPKE